MFGRQLDLEIGVDADVQSVPCKNLVIIDQQSFIPLLLLLMED